MLPQRKHLFSSLLAIIVCLIFSNRGSAQVVYSCKDKYDANVKVYVVSSKSDADLVVYKAKDKYDASDNKGIWFFTEDKYDAKKKIYFVDSKYDADLLVYFTEDKYDAEWKNSSKKQLMY